MECNCFTDLQQVCVKRHQLNTDCIRSIKAGYADGTRANRRTHHKAFLRFCDEYVFEPYPTTEWRLVQFAQFLFAENKKPDTVVNYVSSIRVIHRLAGMECPNVSQVHYAMLTSGLKRKCDRPLNQAEPMDHSTLKICLVSWKWWHGQRC